MLFTLSVKIKVDASIIIWMMKHLRLLDYSKLMLFLVKKSLLIFLFKVE